MSKLFSFLTFILILGCGKTSKQKSSMAIQDVSAIYKSSRLDVHVFYEDGAEPYTEGIIPGVQIWNLTQTNLEALFQGRTIGPVITVPKTLAEMTRLTTASKASWSIDDILELSKKVNVSAPRGTTAFKIFFVNGSAKDGAGIIGFHIDRTRVIAIFKDVIKGMSGGNVFVPRYVEQATIIHEMGHALGLVNNGVKKQSDHHDEPHGAHCKNQDCVMYWTNEGTADMQAFAQQVITNRSTVMFDNQCLEDSRKY